MDGTMTAPFPSTTTVSVTATTFASRKTKTMGKRIATMTAALTSARCAWGRFQTPTSPGERRDLCASTMARCWRLGSTLSTAMSACVKTGRLTCEEDQCLVDEELIRSVQQNSLRHGWTSANYSMFWGRKLKEGLALRTGTFLPQTMTYNMKPSLLRPVLHRIPMEFDARYKPEWEGLISGVRDQGWCGTSWAFSSLDVAQDREMILSGQSSITLSAQELLSCTFPRVDCKGGYVENAWGSLKKQGVMEETCYPYTSGRSGSVPPCTLESKHCKKYKTEPAYRISSKVDNIQWEILTEGPVQALMTVHRDFFLYKSGVYNCPQTDAQDITAMHSVRIVGWGVDNSTSYSPVKYWVVANSWGTTWGDNGFFKIQRGKNTCGIESFVLAVRGRKDRMVKRSTKL
ncbi:hypothetical protein O3P69_007356 [Scylla paramamosain]|uniref:Peptidase C1A papain C-terminal domain-containing protein n=2 Tax=Scylla paramamosain TaxID=85552 RepID=A0AAW0V4C6_SCYPA